MRFNKNAMGSFPVHTCLPRTRNLPAGRSPLNSFSPIAQTDELGLTSRCPEVLLPGFSDSHDRDKPSLLRQPRCLQSASCQLPESGGAQRFNAVAFSGLRVTSHSPSSTPTIAHGPLLSTISSPRGSALMPNSLSSKRSRESVLSARSTPLSSNPSSEGSAMTSFTGA